MKLLRHLMLVLALTAFATLGFSQGTSLNLVFKGNMTQIKQGVAKCKEKSEKERWQANLDLWNAFLGRKLSDPKSVATLKTLKANVAKIKPADEKERWQANLTLWESFVTKGVPTRPEAKKLEPALKTMRANVIKLPTGDELDRWAANFGLWRSVLSGFIQIDKIGTGPG